MVEQYNEKSGKRKNKQQFSKQEGYYGIHQGSQPKQWMMRSMEASIQFGTSSDNIEYEVVEKGSSGFLGFGSKPAVIMARKKEEIPEESFEEAAEEPVKKAEKKPVQKAEEKVIDKGN